MHLSWENPFLGAENLIGRISKILSAEIWGFSGLDFRMEKRGFKSFANSNVCNIKQNMW